jgi:hypothetical protein
MRIFIILCRFAPKPPSSIDHGCCDVLLSQRARRDSGLALVFLSLRSKTAKQHRSWFMVAAPCSCRSGLGACLFFHPERREGSLRSSRKLILKIIVTSRRCVPRTSSIERCHVELNHPLAIGFPRCTRDKGKSAILKKSSSPSGPCPSSRLAGRSRA